MNGPEGPGDFDLDAAGRRIKAYVKTALAQSTRVHTVAQLVRETGLHRNTVYDMFAGKSEPGTDTIRRLAEALDAPIDELWNAWHGRPQRPDTAQEALRRHTRAINEQNRLLRELVTFVRGAAGAIVATPSLVGLEAIAAIDAEQRDSDRGAGVDPPASADEHAPRHIPRA